jgi:hypothetical protein
MRLIYHPEAEAELVDAAAARSSKQPWPRSLLPSLYPATNSSRDTPRGSPSAQSGSGTDGHRSLDPRILAMMTEEHRKQLTETDPTCAGLYAVGAGFALAPLVTEYMEKQLSTGTPGYFCEQTLLALTVKLAGRQLPFEDLPTLPREETALRPAYRGHRWIAGRYAGPTRPQFCRDAWSLMRG